MKIGRQRHHHAPVDDGRGQPDSGTRQLALRDKDNHIGGVVAADRLPELPPPGQKLIQRDGLDAKTRGAGDSALSHHRIDLPSERQASQHGEDLGLPVPRSHPLRITRKDCTGTMTPLVCVDQRIG